VWDRWVFLVTIHKVKLILLVASALALGACAALQPVSPTGPRPDQQYPVLFTEDSQRREAIVVALQRLAQRSGNSSATASQVQLHPITATILSLPPTANSGLFLPKVGANAVMTEEETRESLRRFINEFQELTGADPAKLSLVERVDQPDGTKVANYEQRPFRYPIRGNFGKLQIRFTADRRVVDLNSTCIPDADRIQSAISALNVRPQAEDTIKKIRASGLSFTDASGNQVDFNVPPGGDVTAQKRVVYILPSKLDPNSLEFHLAWEITFTNAPFQTAYVDSLNGEVVAVE
jgi:hypothetical protein